MFAKSHSCDSGTVTYRCPGEGKYSSLATLCIYIFLICRRYI